jgi:hypothetical protein
MPSGLKPSALLLVLGLAVPAEAQTRPGPNREEAIAGQLAAIGLALAGGEICNSVLDGEFMREVRGQYPELVGPNGAFPPERERQIMTGMVAGRLVLGAMPEAQRCTQVRAWFGPQGDVVVNLLKPR